MKKTVLRTVLVIAVAISSSAAIGGTVDAGASKRPIKQVETCLTDPCTEPAIAGKGIRW